MREKIWRYTKYGLVTTLASVAMMGFSPKVNAREITEDVKLSEIEGIEIVDGVCTISDGIHVPKGANVTIDLGGCTVTGVEHTTDSSTSNSAAIVNEGTLVINGEGTIIGPDTYAILNRSGNITINGGNYSNTGVTKPKYTWQGPSLIVNGWYDGSQNPNKEEYSVMTINGGTFTGGLNNVKADEYSILTINDGIFKESPNNVCVLTGGKETTINGGTYDHSIETQSMGEDKEKVLRILGGTYTGSAQISVSSSGAQSDVKYKEITIKDIDIYRISVSMSLNIDNITLENVKFTVSNKLSPFTIASGTNVSLKNITMPDAQGESTISSVANFEISDSTINKIKFYNNSSLTNITGVLNNVIVTDLLTAYRSVVNMTINGGVYNNILAAQSATSTSNGVFVTLNDGTVSNYTLTGAGTLNVNNGTIENIKVSKASKLNVTDGYIANSIVVDDTENEIKLSGGIYDEKPLDSYVVSPYIARENNEEKYEIVYPADYTIIQEALVGSLDYVSNKNNYTSESYKVLEEAINKAKNIVKTYSREEQEDVNKFATDIDDAIRSLVLKSADYSKLDELIQSIPNTLSNYTEDSVEVLQNALSKIDRTKNILEQEDVDTMVSELKSAIEGLKSLGKDIVDDEVLIDSEELELEVSSENDLNKVLNESRSEELAPIIDRAIRSGNTVTTKVVLNEIDETNLSQSLKSDIDKIKEFVTGDTKISKYLDLSIVVRTDNAILGNIVETKEELSFALKIPEDLVKDNRQFDIVRVHDGEVKTLKSDVKDGVITFKTDKFSTYALVYTDIEVEDTTNDELDDTPKTGDIDLSYINYMIVGMGALSLIIKKKLVR